MASLYNSQTSGIGGITLFEYTNTDDYIEDLLNTRLSAYFTKTEVNNTFLKKVIDASLNLNNYSIINLAPPVNDGDAVNLGYLDTALSAIDVSLSLQDVYNIGNSIDLSQGSFLINKSTGENIIDVSNGYIQLGHVYIDLCNNRVGLGTTNPTEDLTIDGNIELDSANQNKIIFYDKQQDTEHGHITARDCTSISTGRLEFYTQQEQGQATLNTTMTCDNRVIINREAYADTSGIHLDVSGAIYTNSDMYENGTALSSKYLQLSGGTMTGILNIQGANSLKLKAGTSSDHTYMEFYADSQAQTTRSGFIGYPSSGSNILTIYNQMTGNVVNIGKYIQEDGVLLSSKYAGINHTHSEYVLKTGDTMSGDLGINGDITAEQLKINGLSGGKMLTIDATFGGTTTGWKRICVMSSNNGMFNLKGVLGGHDYFSNRQGQCWIDLGFSYRGGFEGVSPNFKVFGTARGQLQPLSGGTDNADLLLVTNPSNTELTAYIQREDYTQFQFLLQSSGATSLYDDDWTTTDPTATNTVVFRLSDYMTNEGDADSGSTMIFNGNKDDNIAMDSGNVGIGITNPTEKLQVEGYIRSSLNSEYARLTSFGVEFNRTASYIRSVADNRDSLNIGNDGRSWNYVNFYALNSTRFLEGNVGIGNITPSSKLHIKHNATKYDDYMIIEAEAEEDYNVYMLTFKAPNATSQTGIGIVPSSKTLWSDSSYGFVNHINSANGEFAIRSSGWDTEFAVNPRTGLTYVKSLGVGTTSTSYKLDVNGTANATTLYEGGTALSSKYLSKIQKNSTKTITYANLYVRGCGNNRVNEAIIALDDDIRESVNRGLTLAVINSSLQIESFQSYDTYGSTVAVYEALATAINDIGDGKIGVIASRDAMETGVKNNANLRQALRSKGLTKILSLDTGIRKPYSAVFYGSNDLSGNINTPYCIEKLSDNEADSPYAVISCRLASHEGFASIEGDATYTNALWRSDNENNESGPALWVNKDGYVGIGIDTDASPSAKLHINDDLTTGTVGGSIVTTGITNEYNTIISNQSNHTARKDAGIVFIGNGASSGTTSYIAGGIKGGWSGASSAAWAEGHLEFQTHTTNTSVLNTLMKLQGNEVKINGDLSVDGFTITMPRAVMFSPSKRYFAKYEIIENGFNNGSSTGWRLVGRMRYNPDNGSQLRIKGTMSAFESLSGYNTTENMCDIVLDLTFNTGQFTQNNEVDGLMIYGYCRGRMRNGSINNPSSPYTLTPDIVVHKKTDIYDIFVCSGGEHLFNCNLEISTTTIFDILSSDIINNNWNYTRETTGESFRLSPYFHEANFNGSTTVQFSGNKYTYQKWRDGFQQIESNQTLGEANGITFGREENIIRQSTNWPTYYQNREHIIKRNANADYVNSGDGGTRWDTHHIVMGYADHYFTPYNDGAYVPRNHTMKFKVKNYNSNNDSLTEVMTMWGNGYVGIGTDYPSQKLEVKDGRIRITETDSNPVLELYRDSTTGTDYVNYVFTGAEGDLYLRTGDTTKNVRLCDNSTSGNVINGGFYKESGGLWDVNSAWRNYLDCRFHNPASTSTTIDNVAHWRYKNNFTYNGSSAYTTFENTYNNPFNVADRVVRLRNTDPANTQGAGGWNVDYTLQSAEETHLSIIFVRRTSTSTSGTFYHGCLQNGTNDINGTNGNPYMNIIGIGSLPQGEWCVSIGVINGKTTTITNEPHPVGGIYYWSSGTILYQQPTQFRTIGTAQRQRVYLFYTGGDTTSYLQIWNPIATPVNSALAQSIINRLRRPILSSKALKMVIPLYDAYVTNWGPYTDATAGFAIVDAYPQYKGYRKYAVTIWGTYNIGGTGGDEHRGYAYVYKNGTTLGQQYPYKRHRANANAGGAGGRSPSLIGYFGESDTTFSADHNTIQVRFYLQPTNTDDSVTFQFLGAKLDMIIY